VLPNTITRKIPVAEAESHRLCYASSASRLNKHHERVAELLFCLLPPSRCPRIELTESVSRHHRAVPHRFNSCVGHVNRSCIPFVRAGPIIPFLHLQLGSNRTAASRYPQPAGRRNLHGSQEIAAMSDAIPPPVPPQPPPSSPFAPPPPRTKNRLPTALDCAWPGVSCCCPGNFALIFGIGSLSSSTLSMVMSTVVLGLAIGGRRDFLIGPPSREPRR